MPKPTLPKKETKKKRDNSSGWDWSGFGTDKAAQKEKAAQNTRTTQTGSGTKSSGWDWSSLPTSQAQEDEQQKRYQRQMEQARAANAQAAVQDKATMAHDFIQDRLRGGLRSITGGLTGQRDYTAEDLSIQDSRYRRDLERYSQMAQEARRYGSQELYDRAQGGLERSGGNYNDAYNRYTQAQEKARREYLGRLEQSNQSQYYGETMSAKSIEAKIAQLEREKGRAVMNADQAAQMAGRDPDRAKVYSSLENDGKRPEYMNQLWNAKDRVDQLDAEITRYKAALRHRNSLDKAEEMRKIAEDITGSSNFREMAEVGRAMVENRNRQARDSAIYPMEPEDPDNWRSYQRYVQKEKEALAKAGYVADLDSSYIPEDVKPIYYALFAQSPAKAKEWAEYWQSVGEDDYWRQIYEQSGEDAGARLGAFIQGTFANTVAGLNPFGEGGQYAAKLGKTMIGGGAAGLTEKGLFNTGFGAGTYHSDLFGDISLGSAYQLGSSMLQSAANATLAKMTGGAAELVGGAGTILLGSSAAASDYQEKLEQGWDEGSAKWHALAAGTAESLFEYVSLDKLVNQDVTRGFLKNILVQGGVEASEEALTTIANRVTDGVISELSGNESQIEARARELMEKGYEKGTAEKMAQQEWLTELMSDALGGFVSGGLMSSGQYAMQPVYRAMGAVDDFNRFTQALSSTGETAVSGTEELTRGKAGALAGQIGASLNADTVDAARRITGQELTEASAAQNDNGDAADENLSRREQRRQARAQRKQSTRDGAVYEQAVQTVEQKIEQRGVGSVNEIYAETVEQYGEGAKGIAQEAITRAVSRQLSEAESVADIDRMANTEGMTPEVRAAIQQAKDLNSYRLATQTGDREAAERAIQSRSNRGRGAALNLDVEIANEDGSAGKASITGISPNAERVKLSNGQTVAVGELRGIDADTKDVLDRIAYMEVGPAADILWKSYLAEGGSGTDGYRYVMDWATAYDQGRQGSVSLQEAQGRSSLSPETVKDAYELGEQYGRDEATKRKAELAEKMKISRKGATGRAGSVNTEQISGMQLSEAQADQLEKVKRIAEVFGVDVGIFASGTKTVTREGKTRQQFVGENGRYQDGRIWLDINAGLNYTDDIGSGLVATMSHELTHFIQQYAPEEYRAYKRFVLGTIRQQEGSTALERLIREKIQRSKGQKLSRSAAEDEVVADAAQTVLTDSQAIRQMAEQEPTLFQKVLDWIKDFFDSIRKAIAADKYLSEEARLFQSLEADVRKTFGELWDKGITEAVRVHDEVGDLESESNADQYSLRDVAPVEPSSDDWSRSATFAEVKAKHPTLFALDADESDTRNPTQVKVTVSTYRKIYNMLKAEGFNGTILDASSGLGLGTETGRKEFGFDVDDIEPFPDKSYKPRYTDYSTLNKQYDVVISNAVLNVLTQDLRDAMVVKIGEMLKPGGRAFINVRGDDVLNAGSKVAINEDGMEYFISNTGSYLKGFTRNELKAYLEDALGDGFTVKIRKDFGKVSAEVIRDGNKDIRYSDRDTEYLELAKDPEKNAARLQEMVEEAALAWGARSEEGKPKAFYHSTNAKFTTFKKGHGMLGEGIYFSTYGQNFYGKNQIKAYLKYENPINFRNVPLEGKERSSAGIPMGIVDNFYDMFPEYDAIISRDEELTVKSPSQIKSADPVTYDDAGNVIPLDQRFNAEKNDIRYSDRDSTGRELSEGQKEYFKDSKILDKYGNLLTLYHGTAANFTVFDLGRSGKNYDGWSEYGSGIYLTPDKKFATYFSESASQRGGTPKLMELYANIKNPFNVNDPVTVDVSEYAKKYKLTEDDVKFLKKNGDRWLAFMREHNEDIYDFLTSHGYDGLWDAYGTHAPTQIVAFTENQVKNSDNKNPTENLDIRFSMRDPVETTDRLIAWHNMNEDALRSALELGGLAMPSWAIKTADRAHTRYGKISVIAPRELVDPKLNRSSMIFGGDAWTPVFPGVDYNVTYESADKLEKEIKKLVGEETYRQIGGAALDNENISSALGRSGGSLPGHYRESLLMKYAYLKSIGKDVSLPQTKERLDAFGYFSNEEVEQFVNRLVEGKRSLERFRKMSTDELMQQEDLKAAMAQIRENYYREKLKNNEAFEKLKSHGFFSKDFTFSKVDAMLRAAEMYYRNNGIRQTIDTRAAQEIIDKEINIADYEKWALEKLNSAVVKKGIRNEKDTFTPSGNRRSFDQLHYAYNLANIVKAMKSQPKQGRTQFLSGPGSVKGAALKSYNTVEQVRKDRGRLVDSAEEGQAAYDAYNRNLEDILDRMSKNGDRFDAADALIEVFQHAKTEAAIYNYMQRELKDWYNISRELAHDAYELIGQINQLPMEYFEGKTYDAVRFDETAAVVVPDDIDSALKRQLEDAGARVVEYKAGDDADRLEKVNSVEGAKFSERDYEMPSDLELMDRAVESLSEAGGEEYWKALLESVPELAGDQEELRRMAKDYQEQAKKLEQARQKLKDQLKTTDRKLNTAGINGMVLELMKELEAHDAWGKGVAKQLVSIITDTYQKALDAVDQNKGPLAANDIIYEGSMKAADVLANQATHSEKYSYKWTTASLLTYYGEGGMQAIQDQVAAKMGADFAMHRYRAPIQATAADRIVERTERRMQKQVDAANEKNATLTKENRKLTEQRNELQENWQRAAEQVTFLGDQLRDAREDYKAAKGKNAQEKAKLAKRVKALETQRDAKDKEAKAWKERYEAEAKLNAANVKEARDLRLAKFGEGVRAASAETKLARERVNAKGWEAIADRTAKQIDREMEQKRRLIKQLEAQVQREQDILSGKLKPLPMQRMLAAARELAAEEAKKHKDEVFKNYRERKSQTAIRNRIKNLHAEMQRDLLRPREGHFVPEALIKPVVELLDMVNTQTGRAKSESAQAKIDAINAQYDKLKNDERYSAFYDETVKALLVELSSTLNGRSIYALNSDELSDVYTAMKAMRTTIRNAIRADLVEKGKEIWQIGNELRQELRQSKGAHAYLLEKYHMSMLNAQRAFNRFGGYRQDSTWNKVYRMLDNAQLDMLRIEMEATRIFDPVLKAEADFERAQALTSTKEKDLVDVGLKDENGNAVKITRGMMLGLWMHLQNEDNMRHLMYGGLTLPDFKRYYNGNPEAWGRGTVEIPALGARVSNLDQLLEEQGEEWVKAQYEEQEQQIREMFESVRAAIEEKLTPYDRKWIAASKEFFDDYSRRELNRVTNSMYGFSKAKVDNYFPIVTDSNFLKSEFDSISRNVSLENAGFMKERVRAANPILLEDITRTVNRQISNVSRYAGLTEALKQFGNIYNVQTKGFTDSVKKAMAKSYGRTGQEYIQNLITDMVGGRSTPGTIFDRIKGNYAQAVLSANLSVTIKQAASYPTAAATVGWKPLMKALAKGGKNGRIISRADRALIDTYSPLLWKRSQGAIDTEIGDMAHAQDWTKKAKWLMGWIEKTDIATVGRLWYAAEYYVKDNFNLEKGTAEQIRNGESLYYQKVAEIFNRIVEETQPNYTVLQRPDILRNPNKLLRSLVMFSTQRFQNGQILLDAVAEYGTMRSLDRKGSTEETKAARREAKRKLTWAITSQAVSAVVLNAMTLLAGAVMHRMNPWRDDDDEITLESTAGALMDGFVESLAGSFLGGSELYEALDSLLTGSTYYGNDVGGLSSINDFASAIITMGQKAVKLVGDENSKPEDWANLAKTQLWKVGEYLSQMTGVPVANVKKILEGGVQHVQDAMETRLFSFEAGLSRSNTANARRYAEAWEAGDAAKMQAVIAEMNRNLEQAGKSTDGARDAITKAAKERYEAGEIELDQYADFIRQAGYLEEDKIESKIRDFLRDELVSGDRTEDEVLRLLTELGGLDEDKAWKKVMEWKAKAGDGEDGDEAAKYSEYDALREDLRNGASFREAAADYLDHGYTEKQVRDAAKDDLKARFQSGEISEDRAIDLLVEYSGKDEDACWKTVQGWQGAMEHPEDEDYSWGQYDAIDEALAGNKDVKALITELTAHGVKEENITKHIKEQIVQNYVDGKTSETALKNQLSRYLGIVAKADVDKILKDANSKKLYGVAYSSLDEEYRAGKIGKAELKQALMKQGGMSGADAELKIRWYDLQKANPNLDISESRANSWYDGTSYTRTNGHESAKTAGMRISDYLRAKDELAKVQGVDANGDGRTDNGSREIAYIRALTAMSWLTDRQRRALYYEEYKGTSKTSSRPW